MKCQVVLDAETRTLLEELARPRGNNKSFVVREALRTYAAMEGVLDEIEAHPRFRKMMESALDDIRHGRVHPHARAEEIIRRKSR